MANVSPMQLRKVGSVNASKRLEYPTNALGYHLVDNGAKLVIGDHSFVRGDAVYVVMEENVDWEDLQRSDPCEECNATTGRLIECNRCNGAWHPTCANCKDEKVHCVSYFIPLFVWANHHIVHRLAEHPMCLADAAALCLLTTSKLFAGC